MTNSRVTVDTYKPEENQERKQKEEPLYSKSRSAFPIHIFPDKIKAIINETNECLNFPIDYIASSICYAISIAIGSTHAIKVKEGWSERPILYMALIGSPGSNKSHPLSFALKPLLDSDTTKATLFKQQYREYEELMLCTKKEREDQEIYTTPEEPILKKYIVSDITPESLAFIHENNKRGIGLYVDELASWFKNFNRYSKGAEEQFWLSMFSGKPIIMDRKGSKSTVSIQNSFIGVVGTIQQGILQELAKGDRSHNGFLDRILFVLPRHIDKQYWNNNQLPKHIAPLWSKILLSIADLDCATDENREPVPIELTYSVRAINSLIKWQHNNVDMCEEQTDETVLGIHKKMETYVSRFALLIQMMKWVCNESDKREVDNDTVLKAIDLIKYFTQNAINVQSIINNRAIMESLSIMQRSVYKNLTPTFATSDGVNTAEANGMPERTFKQFVKNRLNTLFSKDRHGAYRKLI